MCSTPVFEPHITLVSSFQGDENAIRDKASELAASIRPLDLTLQAAAHSDYYFRCVFLDVLGDPELLKARDIAQELFVGTEQPEEYRPHLSLVYGDLSAEERESIVQEIGDTFRSGVQVEEIRLCLASADIPPEQWRKIEAYCLRR
jgi:2'-5' RNA ligase